MLVLIVPVPGYCFFIFFIAFRFSYSQADCTVKSFQSVYCLISKGADIT